MKVAKTVSIDPEVARRASAYAWERRMSFSALVERGLVREMDVKPDIRTDIQPTETFKASDVTLAAEPSHLDRVTPNVLGGIGRSRPAPKPGGKR